MRYPSLKSVNLVVLDGRGRNSQLPVYMSGCLLALANRFDGHVLVLCSTKTEADEAETLGEEVGLDFFFHGDQVSSTNEFLAYCESAQKIIKPDSEFNQDNELKHLRDMGKRVIMPESVANTVEAWPEMVVLRDEEIIPRRIMELILA